MTIVVDERRPSVAEYNALRATVGWPTYESTACALGLAKSLHMVCVRDGRELVAFGRVIGDGSITFYIQDVIVVPGHRGLGYARIVMDRLMAYIASVAAPDAVVGLMSAKGVEGLYERYGFVRRPTGEHMGAGMVLLEDIENDH